MIQVFDKRILANGLVVLGEPMEAVQSVAFGFMLPAGASRLPSTLCGAANVISDWVFRGAGERNSRQHSDALDGLGLHRAGGVGSTYLSLGGVLEASNLDLALPLFTDMIAHPTLAPDQFELARQLAVDDVLSLDDDPRQKVMLTLRERFYPVPLGTSTLGKLETLQALTEATVADLVRAYFDMGNTFFSVAGKYDFEAVCEQLENLLQDVSGQVPDVPQPEGQGQGDCHLHHEGAQTHIGLMTPTVTQLDPDYYKARVAVSILSGGMSSRLFTEVREKRGLCYAIGARYHGLKEAAGVCCYAGTTPEKAAETLAVIQTEFANLTEDITADELDRAKIGLKSTVIMQSESSSSRASSLGGDYALLGRVRTVDEVKAAIDAVTIDGIVDFLHRHPLTDFTKVTIGPEPIASDTLAG